jgi:hypothetical protein
MWGLVYVGVCVPFKAIVKTFPILGGLFQVFRWAITNFVRDRYLFSENYYYCESYLFLKELLELIKLILWRSNNQTYHLDS